MLLDGAPNHAPDVDPAFRRDMLAGFARTPKATPPIWFYDRRGSELFEAITQLPEYYPTRTETALLSDNGAALAKAVGAGRAVVEFGAGSARKTPLLLNAIEPAAYVPVDISGAFLRESSARLATAFPGLPVLPIEADFTRDIAFPASVAALPKLGFFPGSTIGNMEPHAAVDLLRAMRHSLGEGSKLLIGMDQIKDIGRLLAAYDDSAGVTAAFNLNLLERINRELDGDIPVRDFLHKAIWNDDCARIEMHLEARRDVDFTFAGQRFAMAAGETVHTESSHKYGQRDGRLLLRAAGWEPTGQWMDGDGLFTLLLADAAA